MTTTNLWKRLKQLLPEPPLLAGTVSAVDTYGAIVTLPDGSNVAVRGTAVLDTKVFIRNGIIEGTAPDLPISLIEV